MISYITLVVALGGLFFLLSYCADRHERRQLVSGLPLDGFLRLFRYRNLGEWVLLVIWVLCVFSPLFYEFPRWGNDRYHIVHETKGKAERVQFTRPRKIPWYGTFHPLFANARSLELADGPAQATYIIVTEDLKVFKRYEVTVRIQCTSWPDFLFDLNNAPICASNTSFCAQPSLVVRRLAHTLRDPSLAFEDTPERVQTLCDRWLDGQRMHSVRAKVVSIEEFPSPDRRVWVQ